MRRGAGAGRIATGTHGVASVAHLRGFHRFCLWESLRKRVVLKMLHV